MSPEQITYYEYNDFGCISRRVISTDDKLYVSHDDLRVNIVKSYVDNYGEGRDYIAREYRDFKKVANDMAGSLEEDAQKMLKQAYFLSNCGDYEEYLRDYNML